jgi:hypothetical protein
LVALLGLAVHALRRQTAREFPHANRDAALRSLRTRLAAMRSGERRPAATNGHDRLSELERLGALHDSGVLDDVEFKAQKERVLL